MFRVGDKQISCTCSVGIGMIDPRTPDAATSITDAIAARRSAQDRPAAIASQIIDHQDEDTQQQAADEIWVRHIKAALMENRFRLMQQPIASLLGEDRGMFDVLVRMIDEQGQEVLPSEFMAAAERNDLMKNIDRWVIGAAMTFCASRPVKQLFVRLSQDSVRDKSLRAVAAEPAQGDAHRAAAHRVPGQRAGRDGIPGRRDRARDRRCARQASSSRSSISAPAAIRSACSRTCRSTTSRSTAR